MSSKKSIYLSTQSEKILEQALGLNLSSKINGIICRYGEIITIKPELAISEADAVRSQLEELLKR